jgi:CHASE3 domain sensor protein
MAAPSPADAEAPDRDSAALGKAREVRRRLRLVLLGLGLLVVALAVASILIARGIHDAARSTYVQQVIPLQTASRDLALQLVNQETSVRGYVITRNRHSLEPYSTGVPKEAADLSMLETRAGSDPLLGRLLLPVLGFAGQLRVFFTAEIELVASGVSGQHYAAHLIEHGRTIFDHFRAAISAVEALAALRTAQANARQDSLLDRLVGFVGVAGLASVALVALLAWRVPRSSFLVMRGQQRAQAEAERLRREAEAVQMLTAELSSAVTVADVRAAVREPGRTLLGADTVSIGLFDSSADRVEIWSSGPADGAGRETVDAAGAAAERAGKATMVDGLPRFLERLGSANGNPGALALLPLAAPGEPPHGYLALHYRDSRSFPESERRRLRVVAGQVEGALARALVQEQDRRAAEALQRALLPASLPAPARGNLVGYYRPGSEGAIVGGDWYDAVLRDDGVIAGSVGDVAGHGIAAAALMGRLRHSYRAYALERNSPAEILARLTRHLTLDAMATALCFDVDPAARLLRYCSAGHPPAIVHFPERGETFLLDELRAPPLGAAQPGDFVDARVAIEPRTVLFAYTDGLVEQRRVSLSDRIQALTAKVAETPADDLEAYVAAIVAGMATERGNPDDIAVLALTI